jgi:hypothetical protein
MLRILIVNAGALRLHLMRFSRVLSDADMSGLPDCREEDWMLHRTNTLRANAG